MQTDRPQADRPPGTGGWQGTVGQYLVVVAELQCVPLPVAHAPRQVGAHHRAGFPCGDRDKCCGEPGGVPDPPGRGQQARGSAQHSPLLILAPLGAGKAMGPRGRAAPTQQGPHPQSGSWPPHIPRRAGAEPTCGVFQLQLPLDDLHGQEVVPLVQAPVVEQEPAGLHRAEPGQGERTGAQGVHGARAEKPQCPRTGTKGGHAGSRGGGRALTRG